MSKLLYVQSPPPCERSESRAIAEAFLESFRAHAVELEVDVLDLWETLLPPFDEDKATAKMTLITGQELAGCERTARGEVAAAFARFDAADTYLFTVPLWDAGVPWVLKQYIATLTPTSMLSGLDPVQGHAGPARGKTAVAIYTSSIYRPGVGEAFGSDFHSSLVDDWLRFCGIDDIHAIRFRPTLLARDIEHGRQTARAEAARLGRELAERRLRQPA